MIMKKTGFTLAEVLITLAIIGVVAVMTLPTLVRNYQEKVWNESSRVINAKLLTAIRSMNAKETLSGHTTTEEFITELGKNIKIVKVCESDNSEECLQVKGNELIDFDQGGIKVESPLGAIFRTSEDLGHEDWGTNAVGVVFADGVSAVLAYNPDCVEDSTNNQFNATSCVAGLYDVSGQKKPNTLNKDVRTFGSVIIKSGAAMKFNNKYWASPVIPPYNGGRGYADCITVADPSVCGPLANNQDFWASAAVTCGGADKLPSETDLIALGNALFDGNTRVLDQAFNTELASIFLNESSRGNERYFLIWGDTPITGSACAMVVTSFAGITYYFYTCSGGDSYLERVGRDGQLAVCRVK